MIERQPETLLLVYIRAQGHALYDAAVVTVVGHWRHLMLNYKHRLLPTVDMVLKTAIIYYYCFK